MTPDQPINLPIRFPDGAEIPGYKPIVLIGPNGVGKTRLGTKMSSYGYDRIPALRSLSFDASIPFQKGQDATREVESHLNQSRNSPWMMANELNYVLSELKAEDSQSAVEYRDSVETKKDVGEPEVTRLKKLVRMWRMIFPGRIIDLSTYDPKVKWGARGSVN